MQIPIKNKILKIITGIAVAITIIGFGWFFLSPFWFWVSLEIIAAALVAVGCSGEWWLHHHPAGRKKNEKDEHHKIESRFISMVAIGVIMELFALGHSITEGIKLEEKIVAANKIAANAEKESRESNLAAKQLEIRLNETKTQLANAEAKLNKDLSKIKWRRLSWDKIDRLSYFLKNNNPPFLSS